MPTQANGPHWVLLIFLILWTMNGVNPSEWTMS